MGSRAIEPMMGQLAERVERLELLLFALPEPDFHKIDRTIQQLLEQQSVETPSSASEDSLAWRKSMRIESGPAEELKVHGGQRKTIDNLESTAASSEDIPIAESPELARTAKSSRSKVVTSDELAMVRSTKSSRAGAQRINLLPAAVQKSEEDWSFPRGLSEERRSWNAVPGARSLVEQVSSEMIEDHEGPIELWEIHSGGFLKEVW